MTKQYIKYIQSGRAVRKDRVINYNNEQTTMTKPALYDARVDNLRELYDDYEKLTTQQPLQQTLLHGVKANKGTI